MDNCPRCHGSELYITNHRFKGFICFTCLLTYDEMNASVYQINLSLGKAMIVWTNDYNINICQVYKDNSWVKLDFILPYDISKEKFNNIINLI